MSYKLYDDADIQDIAGAIREKNGSQDTYKVRQMGDAIRAINTSSGLTEEVKQALLDCFENVAWINDQGQTYYDALYDALYPPATLVSISAVYTQSGTVYDTDTLDSLKSDLVVTAHYSDQSTQTITTYTLSGTLAEGTSTITVLYGGKTTTFDVVVTDPYALPTGYTKYDYVINNSNTNCYVDTGIGFDYCAPEYHHKIKFRVPTYPSSETQIYGARGERYGGTWNTENLLSIGASGALRMGFSGSNNENLYTSQENELIEFETYHQIISVNGEAVKTVTTSGKYDGTVIAPICLFGYAYGKTSVSYMNTSAQIKFYEYIIIDENGDEVLHLQPCKNASNQAGFYDFVSQTFKTAATITSLSCGNDVA